MSNQRCCCETGDSVGAGCAGHDSRQLRRIQTDVCWQAEWKSG